MRTWNCNDRCRDESVFVKIMRIILPFLYSSRFRPYPFFSFFGSTFIGLLTRYLSIYLFVVATPFMFSTSWSGQTLLYCTTSIYSLCHFRDLILTVFYGDVFWFWFWHLKQNCKVESLWFIGVWITDRHTAPSPLFGFEQCRDLN